MDGKDSFRVYKGEGKKREKIDVSNLGVDKNTFPSNSDYIETHNNISIEKKKKIIWIFRRSLYCLKEIQRFVFPANNKIEGYSDTVEVRKKISEDVEKAIFEVISELSLKEDVLLAESLFKEIKISLEKLSNYVNNFNLVQKDELSIKRSKKMRKIKRQLDDNIGAIVNIYLQSNNITTDEYEKIIIEFYT